MNLLFFTRVFEDKQEQKKRYYKEQKNSSNAISKALYNTKM